MKNSTLVKKLKRQKSVRAKTRGDENQPRLTVFRSNTHIYAQIINDVTGKTLVSAASLSKGGKSKTKNTGNKTEQAKLVGMDLAKKAISQKITRIKFDRGSNKYHGRVKALADGAREGGLIF